MMFVRRMLAAAAILFAATSVVRCDAYLLAESDQTGDCFHVTLDMKLTGEIRVRKGDDAIKLKLTANASHDFQERVRPPTPTACPKRMARVYETAKAGIHVNNDASERTLRPERRLVVAQRDKQRLLVYSPAEVYAGRGGNAAISSTRWSCPACWLARRWPWRHMEGAQRRGPGSVPLRGPDGADPDRQAGRGQGRRRDLLDHGTSSGIDQGAMVKMTINATGKFDLNSKRVVELNWTQKDDRDQGPVARPHRGGDDDAGPQADRPAGVAVPGGADVGAGRHAAGHAGASWSFCDPRALLVPLWPGVADRVADRRPRRAAADGRGDFVAQSTVTPWTQEEKAST